MSDRYNSLIVFLEKDLKDEDAEPLIEAIKQFRGVLSVQPNVSNMLSILAEDRAKADLREKIWELLRSER
jgi:hypothetical protein